MREILLEYDVNPTTWVYLSALMTIGIYFKFRRFWSIRNLDLAGLIAYSPGLLLVSRGQELFGCAWLLTVNFLFLIRLLIDTIMVRRPLLEPNLSASGLTFTCVAMLMFLTGNVVTGKVDQRAIEQAHQAKQMAAAEAAAGGSPKTTEVTNADPGFLPFHRLADGVNVSLDAKAAADPAAVALKTAAQTTAILGHLAIVLGMVLIGYRHFDNIHTGVAAATLYLLLPYTAEMTNQVDHVVPGALLVWAVQCYRRPAFAGIFLGLAAGMIFYPLFLLPLWCGFYWRRGLVRFLIAVAAMLALLSGLLAISEGPAYCLQLRQMFGYTAIVPQGLSGIWGHRDVIEPVFRIPVIATYCVLCVSFAIWPVQKNLGTLLSCSAAVMLGTQFWHPDSGGIFLAWYLPLLILTIFRPNLEDRVALGTVREFRLRART